MPARKSFGVALAAVAFILLLGSGAGAQMHMTGEKPSIRILSPEKGQTVTESNVVVRLEVKGLVLKHAGEHVMGTGHVHLFLDKVPDMFSELPRGVPGVWHGAETTFTLKDVPPGLHILTAVLGTGMHGWVRPPAVDSIHFFVVPERQ